MYNNGCNFVETKGGNFNMLYEREVIRSIYGEISCFHRSLEEAEAINEEWSTKNLKARECPFRAYMEKQGASLQFSLAMLYRLHQNYIKSYIGVYNTVSKDNIIEAHTFVMYKESLFRWYVADFKKECLPQTIGNPARISVFRYRKLKGKLLLFNPYDKPLGNLPIFDGFFFEPVLKL